MTRTFTASPAVRAATPLFIGITGPSSSGKTTSALRLATGIQRIVGGDIHLIDTENRRALHYSDMFKFHHVQFDPPFGSLDYLAALEQSASAGAKTIIIDSASHEHESVGGLLDAHETELDRIAGDDWKKRERCTMLAWQKPKGARRKLLQSLTRLPGGPNIIMCFRAKTTSKPIKNKEGKTEIVPMGFMPIAGDEFVYEMTLGCLLMPGSNGIPTWSSENMGERMAIKPAAQFRDIIREGEPLSEEMGMKLAQWAQGTPKAAAPTPDDALLDAMTTAAKQGTKAFTAAYNALKPEQKAAIKPIRERDFIPIAREADAAAVSDTAES